MLAFVILITSFLDLLFGEADSAPEGSLVLECIIKIQGIEYTLHSGESH
jgi:hypothetical protein